MTALNVGYRFVSAEFGNVFVVDWQARAVHRYYYGGLGGGASIPIVTAAASLELGGLRSGSDVAGWGYALSAFAAAGPRGIAVQYFSDVSGENRGVAAGYAAGFGASVGGIVTYTRFAGTSSFAGAPQPVKALLSSCP